MASASTQSSSSSSGSIGSGQNTTMASHPAYQMLNHTLPVKLDRTNYILWKSQIDNVVFANGFEDFIDGSSICPDKELSSGLINPAFVAWRRQDRTILENLLIFLRANYALRLELRSTKKGSLLMIDYIMKVKGAADSLAKLENLSRTRPGYESPRGLGSDYNAIVIAINVRDDKISIEVVHDASCI
ncbi:hypothetical protein AAG906_016324 [Vitis piasezkii]